MAVANTKSTAITALDNSPPAQADAAYHGGVLKEAIGYCEVAAADDDTSVYRFCRLPSNARVSSIEIMNDAITGATDYNLGLYDTADEGGADVDQNLFRDAIDISAGNGTFTEIDNLLAEENREKTLWEALGLSADPHKHYDVCLTGVTVGSGAGTIALRVRYV